jgi:hypothetical protein
MESVPHSSPYIHQIGWWLGQIASRYSLDLPYTIQQSLANCRFANHSFEVSAVFRLYPVVSTAMIGFIYPRLLFVYTLKKDMAFALRDLHLLELKLQWHLKSVF